jgi:hypothetical protein
VDTWKSALLTLPDGSYFELMRSIFGNIKTPFNKQRLVEDMKAFLSRREIQETIAAYIDETDAKIITAIAILEEPAPGELETFFTGEFTYAELHSILINLEERLILYRFHDKGLYRLALNPLLEPILSPIIADRGSLFPSKPIELPALRELEPIEPGAAYQAEIRRDRVFPLDDRTLAALFAFISGESGFFKAEGGIRKRILEDGKALFPGLDLESVIAGLQKVGLLRQEGDGLLIDESKLSFFRTLSFYERMEYCVAGICMEFNPARPIPGRPSRSRIQTLAKFIHVFMDVLKPGHLYPKSTLRRIMDILERKGMEQPDLFSSGDPLGNSWTVFGSGEGSSAGNPSDPSSQVFREKGGLVSIIFDSALDAMRTVGLMGSVQGSLYFRYPPDAFGRKDGNVVIAMDTAFSCILYPEINFEDALALASFCVVRETGTTVRFEITRESVVRGFDRGNDAASMAALLDRLSGNQVDQNLRWTLTDWEARYSGVSLNQGLVLTLAEDRRYLAEAEPVASLISRTLAPGIYLLSVLERADAIQVLHKAGIDIIAQPPQPKDPSSAGNSPERSGEGYTPYPSLETFPRFHQYGVQTKPVEKLFPRSGSSPVIMDSEKAEAHKERFRSALKKISLSQPERDELSARIERRLILNETQLVGVSVKYEKLEARGLDYVGKTSIAKQAIASKLLIEIMWSGQDGETNRVIGTPGALEKSGGETILVLEPVPPGDIIRLPLGKISLLRRIKQSIFGE